MRRARHTNQPVVAFVFDAHEEHLEKANKKRLPYNLERPITLGERKSLARTSDRRLLDRVVRDPDPSVVKSVLENPHVTESDVLAIASSKANGAALMPVVESARWIVRYDVRTALCFNELLPLRFALPLTTSLRSRELRAIREGGTFRAPQAELANVLLTRRPTSIRP